MVRAGTRHQKPLRFRQPDPLKIDVLVSAEGFPHGLLAPGNTAHIGAIIAAAGIPLLELRPAAQKRLEDLFMRMTREPVETPR